jgi:hypothetical protein
MLPPSCMEGPELQLIIEQKTLPPMQNVTPHMRRWLDIDCRDTPLLLLLEVDT